MEEMTGGGGAFPNHKLTHLVPKPCPRDLESRAKPRRGRSPTPMLALSTVTDIAGDFGGGGGGDMALAKIPEGATAYAARNPSRSPHPRRTLQAALILRFLK